MSHFEIVKAMAAKYRQIILIVLVTAFPVLFFQNCGSPFGQMDLSSESNSIDGPDDTDPGSSEPPVIELGQALLSWDPNTEPDLAGYIVYVGNQSGNYTTTFEVTNAQIVNGRVTYLVSNLASGQTYYFAVTAFDTSGNESDLSNEVMKVAP